MKDQSFHDYIIHDLLGDVPDITSRAMFGGWAIYKYGIVFGIIADGELYFKVDTSNRSDFERLQSRPFVYEKATGKQVTMSYWLVPEEILEHKQKLLSLMEKSIAVNREEPQSKKYKQSKSR